MHCDIIKLEQDHNGKITDIISVPKTLVRRQTSRTADQRLASNRRLGGLKGGCLREL